MKYFIPLLLALMVPTKLIFAHPPSNIMLEFDPFEYTLMITIPHSVNDPGKHYVYKIIVELNGKEIIKQEFKAQWSEDEQVAIYQLPDAQHGDEVSVTAYCNISGKKKGTIQIILEEVLEPDE